MKPKESKEELKMKNKNLVKKVAVASLATLMAIPNITNAYNVTEQMKGTGIGPVLSATNQGKYTQIEDDWGNTHLVNSNQWQEYQLLLQQGSPKVKNVWTGWNEDSFYAIAAYQLEGQQKVELPKDKYIKVSDPYNCDQLSVLKYLGNTLGSQYLFNEEKAYNDMVKQAQKNNARAAAEASKQQAEAQRSAEESARNAQINAEMWINNKHHTTQLPYSSDYIKNYSFSQVKISHDKIWASFDNERNYVQQWLTKHRFKDLKALVDNAYIPGVTHYKNQELEAIQYFKDIESGKLPQNCSTGDWLRNILKKSAIRGWNWLVLWTDKADFSMSVNFTGGKTAYFITYEDEYKLNTEIYNMLEANLPVIANYSSLSKEAKTQQVELLANISLIETSSSQGKKYVSGYESRTELIHKIRNKWNTEYLPNIKE